MFVETSSYPDGSSRWCHVCGESVTIDPSFFGDSTCPQCGSLIWSPIRMQKAKGRLIELAARMNQDTATGTWKIDLSTSDVRNEDLPLVADLGPIIELDLSDTRISDQAFLISIGKWRRLEVLELTATKITDQTLSTIQHLHRLQMLGLAETALTDEGLRELRPLSGLWCLDLDRTSISDAGLEQLTRFTRLEWLFLSETNISDLSIPSLLRFPCLEELWLNKTQITEAGIKYLRCKMPDCRIEWSRR